MRFGFDSRKREIATRIAHASDAEQLLSALRIKRLRLKSGTGGCRMSNERGQIYRAYNRPERSFSERAGTVAFRITDIAKTVTDSVEPLYNPIWHFAARAIETAGCAFSSTSAS